MASSAVQSASTVAGLATGTSGLSGADSSDMLQTVLAAILSGVRDIFQRRQQLDLWLIGALDSLAMTEDALDNGLPAALALVCSSPGPDDLAPPDAELQLVDGSSVDEGVSLRVGGAFYLSADPDDEGMPVEVEIDAPPEGGDVSIMIRGGGGLLCGLLSTELYVDGEPLRLDPSVADSLEATLDIRAWPEDQGDDAEVDALADDDEERLPQAVEVALRFSLPAAVMAELLEAQELTFWAGDVAAAELRPADSDVASQLREAIVGPEEVEEPELPDEVIEQLQNSEP